jgi:hypothetical protein
MLLRSNPSYELVRLQQLPVDERRAFGFLADDPDHYALLRPAAEQPMLSVKSVSRDTALLFQDLRTPGPLPGNVRQSLGGDAGAVVARLVLDGIVEIEHEGRFVSGAEAIHLVPGIEEEGRPATRTALLSIKALQYAQRLPIADSRALSARLYFYNRVPVTPQLSRRLPDADSVRAQLGLKPGSRVLRGLSAAGLLTSPADEDVGWLSWRQPEGAGTGPIFKLYVSPALEQVREAFAALVDVARDAAPLALKVGADVYGLLRPDKLVAYLRGEDELEETSRRLAETLDGCPAHGVPFTAELAGGGLLSWGIDPPPRDRANSWLERESWRLWLTNRLALALLSARRSPGDMEPWRFALRRVRLEGVDTDTWTPQSGVFGEGWEPA